jgi:hypothetical protein
MRNSPSLPSNNAPQPSILCTMAAAHDATRAAAVGCGHAPTLFEAAADCIPRKCARARTTRQSLKLIRVGLGASHAPERNGSYQRHRPEATALYELVRDNLETLSGARQ